MYNNIELKHELLNHIHEKKQIAIRSQINFTIVERLEYVNYNIISVNELQLTFMKQT